MKHLTTTVTGIYEKRPCREGFTKLLNGLFDMQISEGTGIVEQFRALTEKQQSQEVTLLQVLDINGVKDAFWVLRCWDYDDYCLLNASIAESVLHIYEKRHLNSQRPRVAIESVRLYKSGGITKEPLAAYADAAYAAAYTAADAADAAAYADAADVKQRQWGVNEKLMREFIK